MLNPDLGVLLITHYQRLLNYITPDVVHVLAAGRIVKTGGKDLALRLEDEGYGPILREAGLETTSPTRRSTCRPSRPRSPLRRPAIDDRPPPPATATRRAADPRGPLDPVALRADFPILARPDPRPSARLPRLGVVAARSRRSCIDAMDGFYREYNANVHRGIYEIGERATAAYEAARATVARFINAPDSHEIVFTRNATEAINLVAYSWGRRNIDRGDAIVLTEMEHHANLVPWQLLAQERDGDLEFIPITDDGILRLDVFEVLLRLKPKLVAFTHVSNTLGTINPVREMVEMAHAAGALVLIDGAQAVPHVPVDVQELGARLLRVQRPQDARPDRLRRALGAARAARGDAAVPRRRRDDPRGPPPPVRLERDPLEVRGGHAGHRRRDRARRGGRVPRRARDGRASASTSASWSPTRSTLLPREVPAIELYGPLDAELRGGVIPFNLPGRPPARRRAGPGPLRRRRPGRPPLHDAAPRAARPGGDRARQLQRLLDPEDIDALVAGAPRGQADLRRNLAPPQ